MKNAFFVSASIACGKSTFIKNANSMGFESLSADEISRQILEKNAPLIAALLEDEELVCEGQINRKSLALKIFKDSRAKAKLENFMHPKIREELLGQMQILDEKGKIFFAEVPLFFESEFYKNLAPVILIYAPKKLSLQRLMRRDGLSKEEALRRIDSQMDIEKKIALADFVLENTGDFEAFRRNCLELIERLSKDRI